MLPEINKDYISSSLKFLYYERLAIIVICWIKYLVCRTTARLKSESMAPAG